MTIGALIAAATALLLWTDGRTERRRLMDRRAAGGVRPATALVTLLAIITGANLFTEPYLLTGRGGPDGATITPVLLMYQRGIEQGKPDVAAAIGVVLVIVVMLIALVNRRITERD